jgi:hypothetical protein
MRFDSTLSPEYSRSLGRGAIVVGVVFAVSALLLDGGLTARITLMVALGYLAGVAMMAVRRPQAPTATDISFLRWGFLQLWFATQVCARLWMLRGLL